MNGSDGVWLGLIVGAFIWVPLGWTARIFCELLIGVCKAATSYFQRVPE
jgi:hypothetical protein